MASLSLEPIQILLVEDNIGDLELIKDLLQPPFPAIPFEITHNLNFATAIKTVTQKKFDVVLLTLSLPDSRGLDSFVQLYQQAKTLPIIVLSHYEDENLAIEAVRYGAQDYLVKAEINRPLLVRSIRYAIERQRLLVTTDKSPQLEQELLLFEQFPTGQKTAIAARTYGEAPLQETATESFEQFVQRYSQLLDLTLEQRIFHSEHPISERLRVMAEQIAFLKGSPRDVVAIHTQAIREKIENYPSPKAQIYLEESRIIVLQLMGYLASYYRKSHLAFLSFSSRGSPNTQNHKTKDIM